MSSVLAEPWTFHFPYKRTCGPVVGRFLDGLKHKRILGLRMKDGGVLVPPHGHDPRTADDLDEWVEVGTEGEVVTWTWIPEPLPHHPHDRPFAFAMIQLDGAATAMLHAVLAESAEQMKSGMRVRVRWAPQLRGHISDIAGFDRIDAPVPDYDPVVVEPEKPRPPERWRFDAPFTSDYLIRAGKALSVHLRGLAEGKLIGLRGSSGNVYVPPTGADPITGDALGEVVELEPVGTVVRYCVVNIPVRGQAVKVPFAAADVLIDGSDTPVMALIQGIDHGQVRLGLRVRAVWVDEAELAPSMSSIKWFEPSGEADAELSGLEDYL
jgi:uncharacterized OB-fold protein